MGMDVMFEDVKMIKRKSTPAVRNGWNACVRVNKLYTVERSQLLNPVSTASPIQMAMILAQLRVVLNLR
jgi:hypothetical protein